MPAFASVLSRLRWLRWPAALIASLLLAGALSMLRFAIPPATLWVHGAHAVAVIDAEQRTPGPTIKTLSADELTTNGLYEWPPNHAPRGLDEQVVHHWWHEGPMIDSIPLEGRGSRTEARQSGVTGKSGSVRIGG